MKGLFLAFIAFLVICLSGCMSVPLTYKEKVSMGSETAIIDHWATAGIHARASGFGEGPAMRAVTLVVGNPTDKPVRVEASCQFEDHQLFGKSDAVEIEPYTKRKIMVRGFNQCSPGVCGAELIYCSLKRLR